MLRRCELTRAPTECSYGNFNCKLFRPRKVLQLLQSVSRSQQWCKWLGGCLGRDDAADVARTIENCDVQLPQPFHKIKTVLPPRPYQRLVSDISSPMNSPAFPFLFDCFLNRSSGVRLSCKASTAQTGSSTTMACTYTLCCESARTRVAVWIRPEVDLQQASDSQG